MTYPREKQLEYQKQWRERKRQEIADYNRAYYAEHRDKYKVWKKQSRTRIALAIASGEKEVPKYLSRQHRLERYKRNRVRILCRQNGANGEHLDRLLAEQATGCDYCSSHEQLEIDHRTPISRGGGAGENLHWLCRKCNRAKHTLTEQEFFDHIRKLLDRPRHGHSESKIAA